MSRLRFAVFIWALNAFVTTTTAIRQVNPNPRFGFLRRLKLIRTTSSSPPSIRRPTSYFRRIRSPPPTSSPLAPDERVYDDGNGGGVAIASTAAELPAQQQERPQFIAVPNAVAPRVPVISKGPIGTYEEFSTLYQQLMDRRIRKALTKLSVVGRTADTIKDHPVVELLHNRVRSGSKPGNRMDKYKIGLAIEGGGMRGAVSAGSAAAISLLGLSDAFDSVYGSSAGALIAAFFVSRQLNGTVIYSDVLPRAGKRFLDRSQLLPAMAPVSMGERKPVLNLDYLLNEVVRKLVPLDWDTFWKNNQVQPLNVIASGLNSMQSTALNSEAGHFDCFENLLVCLRASMVVPGVAGPLVRLNATAKEEPYADALIFEPIPFRSAIDDGCTYILTLRTRPDGSEVLGKKASGIYERFVAKRFLKDMNKCHDAAHYMTKMEHLKQYAEDLLILNEASKSRVGVHLPNGKGGGRHVHLLPIAPPDTCVEVNTLASSRTELVRGLKDGFSQAWDILGSQDVVERFPGSVVASALFDCEDERQFEDAWRRLTVMFNEQLAVERSVNFA